MLVELNVFNELDKHVPVYWPQLLQLQQKLIQLQQVLQLEKILKNLASFHFILFFNHNQKITVGTNLRRIVHQV